MSAITAEKINALFGEALNQGQESLEKVSEVTGLFIQDKLRENSFARQVLPPEPVTTAELTRNVDDKGFVYIDDLEPNSIAMTVNMRSEPEKTVIDAPRYAIRMMTVASDRFTMPEQELRTYRMPVTKVIEQNTVKDIQEVVDRQFMRHVRAGIMHATISRLNQLVEMGAVINTVGAGGVEGAGASTTNRNLAGRASLASYLLTGQVAPIAQGGALAAGGTDTLDNVFTTAGTGHANYNLASGELANIIFSEESAFSRSMLRDLVKIPVSRAIKGRTLLMTEFDWIDTVAWLDSEAGLEITKEIVVSGYKYSTVGGYTFVTTVRDNPEIITPGSIYIFPAPEFLGRFLLLESTKFYINKEGRFFHMEAWEELGVGFGNVKGLGVLVMAGRTISLPNVYYDTDGVEIAASGEFRITNNPFNPLP